MSNETPTQYSDQILWIDCEMTGLDPKVDEILEISGLLTDWNLNPLEHEFSYIVKPNESALDQMIPYVRQMHTKNGLLKLLPTGQNISEVDQAITDLLSTSTNPDQKLILAGNTIHSDRKFIDVYLPKLNQLLSYRMLDVTSIKILCQQWYPEIYQKFHKKNTHRALDDIKESIRELKFYRENIFI